MTWRYAGRTGVDSGSILITDPCYVIREQGEGSPYQPFESYEQLMEAASDTFDAQKHIDAAQCTNQFGADIGVYISRFGGDGVFPVYVELDDQGHVIAAQIRFDGENPSEH